MKNESTTRKPTRYQYAAMLFGALAVVALAPAPANAEPSSPSGPSGGCHYTDPDGYDIPIDEGQGVIVGGKLVTCTGGKTVVTAAPNNSGRPPRTNPHQPVATPPTTRRY